MLLDPNCNGMEYKNAKYVKKKPCNVLPYYNQFLLQVNKTLKF